MAGAVCRFVDHAELVPEWAEELQDGTPLWWLFAEAFANEEEDAEHEDVEPARQVISSYEVAWDDALARLSEASLGATTLRALRRAAKANRDHSLVLWIDKPWAEVDYAELATDVPVALTVFAAPFECDGSLCLSGEDLIGDRHALDARAYVFLDEVSAVALTTLPDTLAVFAGGLSLQTAGCFSAADSSTFVASHLSAPCIVSGGGDGGVALLGKVKTRVDTVVGDFAGAPRGASKRSFNDAYPRWAEELDDGTGIWELFGEAFANGDSVEPE